MTFGTCTVIKGNLPRWAYLGNLSLSMEINKGNAMMRWTDGFPQAISCYLGFRPSDLIANIAHDVFRVEVLLAVVSIGGTLVDTISV